MASFKNFHVSGINFYLFLPPYIWLIMSCVIPSQNWSSEVPELFLINCLLQMLLSATYLSREPQVWEMRCLCCVWSWWLLFLEPLTMEDSIALTRQEPTNTNVERLDLYKRTRFLTVTSFNLKNTLFLAGRNLLCLFYSFSSVDEVKRLLTWLVGKSSLQVPESCKAADGLWSRQ